MKNLNKNIEEAINNYYGTEYYGLNLKMKNDTDEHTTMTGSLIHSLGLCKIHIYLNKETQEVEIFEF